METATPSAIFHSATTTAEIAFVPLTRVTFRLVAMVYAILDVRLRVASTIMATVVMLNYAHFTCVATKNVTQSATTKRASTTVASALSLQIHLRV